MERRIDARLRELRALLDWPAEAEFVARARLEQTLNDLITEQMVYARLPDADARVVAEGRIEPFVGPAGSSAGGGRLAAGGASAPEKTGRR
jgi:hypothetical protein